MVEEVFPGMRVVSTNNSKDMIHIPKISSTKISIAQKELNFKIIDSNRTFYVNTMRKKHTIWTKKLIHLGTKKLTLEMRNGQNVGFPLRPYFSRYVPFLRAVIACVFWEGKKKGKKERKKEEYMLLEHDIQCGTKS